VSCQRRLLQGEDILALLTLIVLLGSFILFKQTEKCECFIIFDMSLVFIHIMNSFRSMKGTRPKEAFPHCLNPLGLWLHSLMSMKNTGLSLGCLSFLTFIVSLQSQFAIVNVTGNCSYP
jgi:hypothetical protein